MKPKPLPPPTPRTEPEGEVTITWDTGEVVRVYPDGRKEQRRPVPSLRSNTK